MAASADVRKVFDEYVFSFIQTDIRREIWLADQTELLKAAQLPVGTYGGGGNVLAALGLVAYTEFLGSFISGRKGKGWSLTNFAWAFRKLGQPYRDLRDKQHLRIYDTVRNGLVHEYLAKQNCTFAVRFRDPEPQRPAVGMEPDGSYYFVVEAYLTDMMRVAERIYDSPAVRVPTDGEKPTRREMRQALSSGEDTGLI